MQLGLQDVSILEMLERNNCQKNESKCQAVCVIIFCYKEKTKKRMQGRFLILELCSLQCQTDVVSTYLILERIFYIISVLLKRKN